MTPNAASEQFDGAIRSWDDGFGRGVRRSRRGDIDGDGPVRIDTTLSAFDAVSTVHGVETNLTADGITEVVRVPCAR
ncbi:hypothetical protein VB779_13805 [Haloarculaceae archaeon H-GB11]|nr:hypothetical protein [Haloarculaceae archaeon H-GB11]